MTQTTRSSGVAVQSVLVRYRLVVYVVGLLAIVAPIVLSQVGVTVSSGIRTVIVLASLFVMVLTYVAERQFVHETRSDDGDFPNRQTHAGNERSQRYEHEREYSRQARTAIGFALIGVAVGGYVALEISPVGGLLFVVGALLFVRLAYAPGTGDNR